MTVDSDAAWSLHRTLWKRIRYESDDWRNRERLQIQIIMMNDGGAMMGRTTNERNDKHAVR